ncbi:expansin EXLX1 family cellulose-binding protein [Streptomyces sp. NPDC098781]|uniref:expansin EXLX1 family cellulose-binding protein n=1 Tax=Streptomyces sp. NPDC098781 TaxID=3366097 RepID=UPI00380DC202
MASRAHHRSPRKRHPALAPAAAVAVVAVAVSVLMALRPGAQTTAARPTTTPVTTHASAARTTPSPAEPSRSPSASPSPTKAAKSPSTRPAVPAPAQPASGSAPLAGRIRPKMTYEGIATFYDTGDGDGACLYGPTDDVMTAAMNHTDYETSRACGAYVEVRAANGASVTVRVTNECPLPCAPGQLDLSPQAFARLATPETGRLPITWTLLSPATSERISIRYKTGSSRYWCAIQAVGHQNPLARLEVRTTDDGWRQLPRTAYNYFLSEQGEGCGSAIRLTDIYGETLTFEGASIRPDAVQSTGLQFAAR